VEERRTFNDMVADDSLDELLEATRKLCNHKLHTKNVKLPTYIGREDVMQDAMIKVFQAYRKFDPSKASANTYFTRVIDRVIIDHVRHSRGQSSVQGTSAASDEFGANVVDFITGNISVDSDERANAFGKNSNASEQAQVTTIGGYHKEGLSIELEIDLERLLTERETKVFKLRHAGYTHAEIAEKLKVSRPTVAKDWLQVRKVLSELLY